MSAPLWGAAPPLKTLAQDEHANVCVVGLGAAGLSAIAHLQAAGRSVIGLDQRGVGGGAAGRNGGLLLAGPARFYHSLRDRQPELAKSFYELTIEERDRCMASEPTARASGSYRRCADQADEEDASAHREALLADGFACRWFRAQPEHQLHTLEIPGDGTFDPMARCVRLAHEVSDRARLARARAVEITPERVVTDTGHTVRCEAVLVCLDGGLAPLFPTLGVRSHRLQMLGTAPASDVSIQGAQYYRFGFDYWQQRPDGQLAIGGGRDLGGEEEETQQVHTTPSVQNYLEQLLREKVGSRAPVTHRWAGEVGYTDSGLPKATMVAEGVFVCGGYCGTGNVLSTLCSVALADVALGRSTPQIVDTLHRLEGL